VTAARQPLVPTHLIFIITLMKSKTLNALVSTNRASWAPLPLRLAVGLGLMAHGSQKLFGWFGGYGLHGVGQWMDSIGLSPGVFWAAVSGGGEFLGGLLVFLGLFTRAGALLIAVPMAVATLKVHWGSYFAANNGVELTLTIFVAALSLLISGGGRASLDARLKS
jgi:putative oxidoreductase